MGGARVERLRRVRPDAPLVEVVLDDGERLRVHERRVLDLRLAAGAMLSDGALDALRTAARADACERRALGLIARRPRSRAELAERARAWGLGEGEAAALCDRLAEQGLVDDAALAAAVAGTRSRHGYGRHQVAQDLARLGVVGEAAASATATLTDAEERTAAAVLVRRRYGAGPLDRAAQRRAAGLLERRGFGDETIRDVLRIEDDPP
jgi:regulatory protein